MSAIITETFRKNSTQLFLDSIASGTYSNYFLGIGKQDKWVEDENTADLSIPTPLGTRADAVEVLSNLSTLVRLNRVDTSEIGRVVPAVTWTSGNIYKSYNSYDSDCFYPDDGLGAPKPCYVTINGEIYLCLKRGPGGSNVSPVFVNDSPYEPIVPDTSGDPDGYVWVLVQKQPIKEIIRNNTFTDIGVALDPTQLVDSTEQAGGLISGFHIVSGGTGYDITDTLKLYVNDSNSETPSEYNLGFTVDDNDGSITSVFIKADQAPLAGPGGSGDPALVSAWPKGAAFASVQVITSIEGNGAQIIPVVAPSGGYAADPAQVLPSWFAGIKVELNDALNGDNFYTRYRQISIIKNPTIADGVEPNPSTLNALKYISFLPSGIELPTLSADSTEIEDASGNVIAFADYITSNDTEKRLYFHQNSISGFKSLSDVSNIVITTGDNLWTSTISADDINNGEFINDGNAEVLFTENRSFITRAPGQIEDLTLIIQF
jgi:hypothetical protein